MKPGDSFFVATRPDGTVMVIVVPEGSTVKANLRGFSASKTAPEKDFVAIDEVDDLKLDFAARYILDELGN